MLSSAGDDWMSTLAGHRASLARGHHHFDGFDPSTSN
jgi:hypothetical protein